MGIVLVVVVTDLIGGFSGGWRGEVLTLVLAMALIGVQLMPCVIGFLRYKIL
jgi:hypothetical protein